MYDPALGRFAQADSIVPPGVQGLDRYAYVNNSPMNYVDPSGHFSCSNDPNSDDYCPNHSPSLGIGNGSNSGNNADEGMRACTGSNMSVVCNNHPSNTDPVTPEICTDCATFAPNGFSSEHNGLDDIAAPWELDRLDGIGIRFVDISGWIPNFPVLGGAVSFDLIYNFTSNELSLVPSGNILIGAGEGGSQSESLILVYDTPNNDALIGPSVGGQIDLTAGVGVSASYSISKDPVEGKYSQIYTIGASQGLEASISGTVGWSGNITILPGTP